MARVTLSEREPEHPDADFAIYIDFDRSVGQPQRVFRALDGLITAFSKLDKMLAYSIDPAIEPVMMLEDIEGGSIKVWLKDKLTHVEDQSLYELDWKPLFGKYLVAAKYAYVEWVNDEEEFGRPGSLNDLRKRILALAHDTDVRRMPDYGVPSSEDLLDVSKQTAGALSVLSPSDRARFISDAGSADFNMSIDWGSFDIADAAVKETIISPEMTMILAVKKPDYLGVSQWEFRLGKRTVRAKVEDEEWLTRFQRREVDVRPGDALKCRVVQSASYGYDNELLSESMTIKGVIDVLEDSFKQPDMFD